MKIYGNNFYWQHVREISQNEKTLLRFRYRLRFSSSNPFHHYKERQSSSS